MTCSNLKLDRFFTVDPGCKSTYFLLNAWTRMECKMQFSYLFRFFASICEIRVKEWRVIAICFFTVDHRGSTVPYFNNPPLFIKKNLYSWRALTLLIWDQRLTVFVLHGTILKWKENPAFSRTSTTRCFSNLSNRKQKCQNKTKKEIHTAHTHFYK